MNIVKLAAKADLFFGVLLLIVAAYMVITQSYLMALIVGMGSLVSFIFVKVQPSKWIARRILISRLKS